MLAEPAKPIIAEDIGGMRPELCLRKSTVEKMKIVGMLWSRTQEPDESNSLYSVTWASHETRTESIAQATTVLATPVGRFVTAPRVWYSMVPEPEDAALKTALPMDHASTSLLLIMKLESPVTARLPR